MKKTLCDNCNKEINNNNFKKHHNACIRNALFKEAYLARQYEQLKFKCHYCEKIFSTKQGQVGHISRSHTNKDKQSACGKMGPPKRVLLGHTFITRHTIETKQRLSILACSRLAKHSKYSKNVEYKPGIILESSYEVRTAQILDSLDVEWEKVRRGYVWDDHGTIRRYIPDFYLPKYNIFLDPKNDYLIKKDQFKIESAMKMNNIKVIILSDKQINKDFIQSLLL